MKYSRLETKSFVGSTFKTLQRSRKGSVLLLVLACVCLIVVPLLLLVSQGGLYAIDRDRAKNAVEAAALVAANELSRVIIDDPQFGYVSLSNYPANGKGTVAPDGEPLPVAGINTLTGTIRQIAILGHELQNQTISELAEDDRDALESTIDDLNSALATAVKSKNKRGGQEELKDHTGAEINIEESVSNFLKAHLPPSLKLESFEMENGWLACAAHSSVPLPSPQQFSHTEKSEQIAGEYRAFVDVPLNEKSFTFAGLGKTSALVGTKDFRKADEKHINSIVRVKATFVRNNAFKHILPFGLEAPGKIEIAAAAQPFCLEDNGPAGVMRLRFCGASVSGLHTWRDFLQKDNFHDQMIMTYQSIGGDYPVDPLAKMRPSKLDSADGTSQQFAEHLYYWLRNGHLRPRLGSVLDMLSQRFQGRPYDIYAYEFNNNGEISRRVIAKDPFPPGVTSEEQVSTTIDTRTASGINPVIIFRNNVKRLGTQSGGKHAGQPIAGSPLNWCELAEYGGDDFIAGAVRKGKFATGLVLHDPTNANSSFLSFDGKTVGLQPRRSSYSGGLAVDIEIGGLQLPKQQMGQDTISLVKHGRGGCPHP